MPLYINDANTITDTIQLGENVYSFTFNVGRYAREYKNALVQFGEAQKALQNVKDAQTQLETAETFSDLYTKMGHSILTLMGLIFGDKIASAIIDYFDGDHAEVIHQIVPYIINDLAPRIQEMEKAKQADLRTRYKK